MDFNVLMKDCKSDKSGYDGPSLICLVRVRPTLKTKMLGGLIAIEVAGGDYRCVCMCKPPLSRFAGGDFTV